MDEILIKRGRDIHPEDATNEEFVIFTINNGVKVNSKWCVREEVQNCIKEYIKKWE